MKSRSLTSLLKVHNKHYAVYYPAGKDLFNFSKKRKRTGHPTFALTLFFWLWAGFYRLVVNKNFAKLFNSFFFLRIFFKTILKIKRLQNNNCLFCCNISPQKSNGVLLKWFDMLYFPQFLHCKIPTAMSSMIFNK